MDSQSRMIIVDGRQISVVLGQSLISVLKSLDDGFFAIHSVTAQPGQGFCGMGICFECEVTLDGSENVRACLVKVVDGMTVRTPAGSQHDNPTS